MNEKDKDIERKRRLREKYKFLRISKKITLKEVSEYVGFSLPMLSKYENGQRDMDSERVGLYKEYIDNY